MTSMVIHGGKPLEGELAVHGSKDSVLPILAACLLARDRVVLRNCPWLTDVSTAMDILGGLGCRIDREGRTAAVDPTGLCGEVIPWAAMENQQTSAFFLAALLARTGRARLTRPAPAMGPCLEVIRAMGYQVRKEEDVFCWGRPTGGELRLTRSETGPTGCAMLCALGATKPTTIYNAAREPEIGDLQAFLNALGAHIRGAGSSTVTVEGEAKLGGGEFTVMGDRAVAATLLSAAASAGGRIALQGVDWRHLASVLSVLHQAGCRVRSWPDRVELVRDRAVPLRGVPTVRAAPYPGFPAAAMAPVMAALAVSRGSTLFIRPQSSDCASGLARMGAEITAEGRVTLVRGVERLHGVRLAVRDPLGGGAIAAAALGAKGESALTGLEHIDRSYEGLDEMFRRLGARVERREEPGRGAPRPAEPFKRERGEGSGPAAHPQTIPEKAGEIRPAL